MMAKSKAVREVGRLLNLNFIEREAKGFYAVKGDTESFALMTGCEGQDSLMALVDRKVQVRRPLKPAGPFSS